MHMQRALSEQGGTAPQIVVRVSAELREELEAEAERTGRNLSEVVRERLERTVAEELAV